MTTWVDIHNTARAKYYALANEYGWAVVWDNAPDQVQQDGFFTTYSMIPGESVQVTMGTTDSRRFRHVGVIQVTLYDNIENGDATLMAAADAVKGEFQAQSEDGITYRTPSLAFPGVQGAHYAVAVSIPFYSDEVA